MSVEIGGMAEVPTPVSMILGRLKKDAFRIFCFLNAQLESNQHFDYRPVLYRVRTNPHTYARLHGSMHTHLSEMKICGYNYVMMEHFSILAILVTGCPIWPHFLLLACCPYAHCFLLQQYCYLHVNRISLDMVSTSALQLHKCLIRIHYVNV